MSLSVKTTPFFLNFNRPLLRHFGDPAGELSTATRAGFVADVTHLAMLTFEGEDAANFLQSQLSCDVEALQSKPSSTFGAYCSPKGRMLASFLLVQHGGVWHMVLERSLLEPVRKRLSLYVLRAKVRISISHDTVLLGLGGPTGLNALNDVIGTSVVQENMVLIHDGIVVIGICGGRCLLMVQASEAAPLWTTLSGQAYVTGTSAWEWSDIHGGIPWISSKTQDQFVPQMANLELIGGISFKKGCYPGQEIVARTQYLGKIKRRMYLAHVSAHADAGVELYSEDVGGQSNGMVVNAVAAADGGSDLLGIVQRESVENSKVHLASPDGPILQFMPLPYPIA